LKNTKNWHAATSAQEEAKGLAEAWEKDMAAALERAELDPTTRR
jgi:hypothetical protein